MMISISVPMTLISILILPISGIIVGLIAKKSQKYFKKQQDLFIFFTKSVLNLYVSFCATCVIVNPCISEKNVLITYSINRVINIPPIFPK